MLYTPGGVAPDPEVPPPPPLPQATSRNANDRHSTHGPARRRGPRRTMTPSESSDNAPRPASCAGTAELAAVWIVSVVLAAFVPSGVTELGAKVQLAFAGRPPQARLTVCAKPLSGVTVKVIEPDWTALIVSV